MTLKTIKLKEEAYKKLLERKQDGESVSDVIERLLGIIKEPKNINKFFGLWKDLPAEFFKIMESDRKEIRNEINRRFF